MCEYIDRQAAIDAIEAEKKSYESDIWYKSATHSALSDVGERIKDLPAADVVPVVHARWIKPTGMMPPEHHGHYECSECGAWAGREWLRPWKGIRLTNFCPNCGAKMDKRREETEWG